MWMNPLVMQVFTDWIVIWLYNGTTLNFLACFALINISEFWFGLLRLGREIYEAEWIHICIPLNQQRPSRYIRIGELLEVQICFWSGGFSSFVYLDCGVDGLDWSSYELFDITWMMIR
jgi:hypothetical protein